MSLQRAKAVFVELVGNVPTEQWEARLADLAEGNEELRQRVNQLLAAHCNAASFLDSPAQALGRPRGEAVGEGPGTVIGPFKLLEPIGEGGMGTVWMARQTEPVKRFVAIKLIKPGMDSRQVLTRFEAERQALAVMDHPNIAKVLDAGEISDFKSQIADSKSASSSLQSAISNLQSVGRPYFVMELVKGIPITKYCDEHHLAPRQILELFLPICHAVQHAHQKGIIHRDLKPSNVLVAEYDDKPVAKIIDFGVAKAIGSDLTKATLFTQFGTVVGTLEYMSPEQAKFNALDIDTRSDIYSLGVLLYELLTGTTPLRREQLNTAAFDEVLRLIREDEPQKPSTRLSATRSADRRTLHVQTELRPAFPGPRWFELDWIVMKCLEKDRNRRYHTANGLATDLQRYLANEPVEACPPSATYRLRKFIHRNRGPVLAIGVIFFSLIAGIAGTSWGLVRADHARQAEADQRALAEAASASAIDAAWKATRQAAVAAAINDFLNNDLLQLSSPTGQAAGGVSPDANLKLRTVLQRAAKRIDGKFPNEPEVEMRLRYTIGYALNSVLDFTGALSQYEKVASLSRQLLGRDDPYTLEAEYRIPYMHSLLGHVDIAVPLLEKNVERHKSILGEEHAQTFMAMKGLSIAYRAAGQTEKALQLAEQVLELRKRHLGPTHTDTLVSMNNVALLYLDLGRIENALALYEQAVAAMKSTLDPLHPERLNVTRNLARAYHVAEQIDKTVPLQEMIMQQYKTAYGVDNPATQGCIDSLITSYVDAGFCDKAEALLRTIQSGGENRPTTVDQGQGQRERRHHDLIQQVKPAAEKYQHELAPKKADHPDTLAARQAFAVALREQKRLSAAAYHLEGALDARQRLLGADHPDTLASRLELSVTRLQQKRYAEAVQLYLGWNMKDKADEGRKKLEEPEIRDQKSEVRDQKMPNG